MKELIETSKPKRVDGQVTGLAGELFVAAELLKRGLQASITFGNAKSVDILAYNDDTKRGFTVQVKALRKPNFFIINHAKIKAQHIYVFALLNKPGQAVEYFIVPGSVLAAEPERFTKSFLDEKMPSIHSKTLKEQGFQDAWHVFNEP